MKSSRTYLLTWNPTKWKFTNLAELRKRVADGVQVSDSWSTGNTKRIKPNDRVFIMRLGEEPKGIIASGWCTSQVKEGPHYDDQRAAVGDTSLFVKFKYDHLLNPDLDAILPLNVLLSTVEGVVWTPLASGIEIPEEPARQLEKLWRQHLKLDEDELGFDKGVLAVKRKLNPIHQGQAIDLVEQTEKYQSAIRGLPNQERILRSVAVRRGQAKFRDALLARDQHCVVTGSTCSPTLEAAHICPYSTGGSYDLSNGLLLRADIHTLFDLGFIGIDPASLRVRIASVLKGTEYEKYNGKHLRMSPEITSSLSQKALSDRWQTLSESEMSRWI